MLFLTVSFQTNDEALVKLGGLIIKRIWCVDELADQAKYINWGPDAELKRKH